MPRVGARRRSGLTRPLAPVWSSSTAFALAVVLTHVVDELRQINAAAARAHRRVPRRAKARSDWYPCPMYPAATGCLASPGVSGPEGVHPEGCTCGRLFAGKWPRIDRRRAPLRLRDALIKEPFRA